MTRKRCREGGKDEFREPAIPPDVIYGPFNLKESMWARLKEIQLQYCSDPRENPKKKQLKIWSRLDELRTTMDLKVLSTIGEADFQRVALTVAYAVLNPIQMDWDIERFADKIKSVKMTGDYGSKIQEEIARMQKIFQPLRPAVQSDEPAVVIDQFGRIIVWHLPHILSTSCVVEYNRATVFLRRYLMTSGDSWRSTGFYPPAGSNFGAGIFTLSPGWFMRLRDQPHEKLRASQTFQSKQGGTFMKAIAGGELLCNSVIALITPDLFDLGLAATQKVKNGVEMATVYKNADLWPTVCTAMELIVNRTTPPHRDEGASPTQYDLLLSSGIHSGTIMDLPELGLCLSYDPGTLVSLCGKIFFHEVVHRGGERVCLAHFIKDAVHDRLLISRPGWPNLKNYST